MIKVLFAISLLGGAALPKGEALSAATLGTVDLIEGDYASLELTSGDLVDCPTNLLPEGIREGARVSIPAACE